MKPRKLGVPAGMTLTELLVVSSIMTVLSGMVVATYRYQTQTYRQQSARSATQDSLRVWIDRMVRDLRRAGYDPTGSGDFGLTTIDSTEVAFTFDANADGVLDSGESLGYRIHDGALEQWLGGANYRTLLRGVGGLTFTYRDAQGAVCTDPKYVRMVEIALSVEAPGTAFSASSATPQHTSSVDVGTERTTIGVTSDGGTTVYAHVERATIRNPH